MYKPWSWGLVSNAGALANARAAATELSRLRVERDDVELYLAELRPARTALPRVTHQPA
jgi:hypothetical protein